MYLLCIIRMLFTYHYPITLDQGFSDRVMQTWRVPFEISRGFTICSGIISAQHWLLCPACLYCRVPLGESMAVLVKFWLVTSTNSSSWRSTWSQQCRENCSCSQESTNFKIPVILNKKSEVVVSVYIYHCVSSCVRNSPGSQH